MKMNCNCKELCFSYQKNVYEDGKIVRYKINKCPRLATDKKPGCDFLKKDKISENVFTVLPKKIEVFEIKEKRNYVKMLKDYVTLYENNKVDKSYENYASTITWLLAKYGYKPFIHGEETIEELKIRILKSPDMIKNNRTVKLPVVYIQIPENLKIKNTPCGKKTVRRSYTPRIYAAVLKYDEDEELRNEESEDEGFDMENEESEIEEDYEDLSD